MNGAVDPASVSIGAEKDPWDDMAGGFELDLAPAPTPQAAAPQGAPTVERNVGGSLVDEDPDQFGMTSAAGEPGEETGGGPRVPAIRCKARTAYIYRWEIISKGDALQPGQCVSVWDPNMTQVGQAHLDLSVGMIHTYDEVRRFVPAKNWDPRTLPSVEALRQGEQPDGNFALGNLGGLYRIRANHVPGFLLYEDVDPNGSPLCTQHRLTGNQMGRATAKGHCHQDWVCPRLWVVKEGGDVQDVRTGKGMQILVDLPCPMSIHLAEFDMENEGSLGSGGDLWGNLREILRQHQGASLALGPGEKEDWFGIDTSNGFKFGWENTAALEQIRLVAQRRA